MPDQELPDSLPLIDAARLSKRLKSARKDTDYQRMTDLADEIERRFCHRIATQTLYTYENGRTVPSCETLAMLTAILRPPGGLRFFRPAFREDVCDALFGEGSWGEES